MPKNVRRGGSRAGKSFDPSYARGAKKAAKTQNPGSRSKGHRGYREDAQAEAPQKKARWSAEQRVASGRPTDRRHGDREQRFERLDRFEGERRGPGARPARAAGDARRGSSRERPAERRAPGAERAPLARSERRERGERRFERGNRADRLDRAPRSFAPQDDVVLARLEAETITATDVEGVTFDELGLGSRIVRVLGELGAARPFPIQAATIPDVIAGRNVLGRGRTGSGKTIAFGAPVVELLLRSGSAEIASGTRSRRQQGRAPRALILAPTRELALQIDRTVQPIARAVGLFTTQVYGGVPQRAQVVALERGVDIVIGTPGRILDLVEQGRLDLSEVRVTVLDEADHMCDLGFLEPVQRILRLTADGGQKLLFSATLDSGVAALVDEFLVDPAVHEVAGEDQASGTIDHRVLVIDHREKLEVIRELADRDGKTLVFSRTRSYAEDLAAGLEGAGIPAVALHGDLNQARRTRNLEKLATGSVNVLVATDVAARGIHIDDVDLVIQADAPDEYKTYLHRAGRTGRAGRPGTVITLVSRGRTRRVEELLARAEITAEWSTARPGDGLLARLIAPAVE